MVMLQWNVLIFGIQPSVLIYGNSTTQCTRLW